MRWSSGRTLADLFGAKRSVACAYAYDTPYAVVAYAALGKRDFKEKIQGPAEEIAQEAARAAGPERRPSRSGRRRHRTGSIAWPPSATRT